MDVQISFDFASAGIYAAQYAMMNSRGEQNVAMVYQHCTASKADGKFFPAKKRAPNVSKSQILKNNQFSECYGI